ncbi:MAG: DUF2270 domain-containing protein [Anaerolineae bacterium]|nr:DUF2270 domain-containing protein [Anaerolineae bacterium]
MPEESSCVWTYQGYELDKGNFTTAMVHLYRAEVTRMNLWRNRLDTTTNWAVVTTAGALTFVFSSTQNPHFVLLLVLLLVLFFLNVEARRYMYYSLWYHRARLLETQFFAAMITPPFGPAPDWGDKLSETLREPAFPISHWEALGNRYRRNYIYILTLLLVSWFLKLTLHPIPATDLQTIVARACIEATIPGYLIIGAVLTIYFFLSALALVGYLRFKKRGMHPKPDWQQDGPAWYKPEPMPNLAVIVTNRKDEVATRLMKELGRGVTALEGIGMYTQQTRDVLLCAITDVQVGHLQQIARDLDPDSFVVVTQANAVRGGHFQKQEPPS